MEILRVENLTFKYPGSENTALNGVSFSVNSGDFVVLCGESGCGKTTLLKLLKKSLSPKGELSGEILYFGKSRNEISDKTDAEDIGFVLQNPETQIVTDKVWHELAFGLENLGIKTDVIRRRVAEMANYFGINGWFRKKTSELSGGQKQLLNLAAVMVMQPKVLILDEPTSRLDPIAASDFLATLNKLNRELGLTVIIAEHCLENVFPIADRVLLMENGKVLLNDSPRNIAPMLSKTNNNHKMLAALPAATRVFGSLETSDDCPLTVKEGRAFLQKHFASNAPVDFRTEEKREETTAIELKNVWFRYEKDLPDILRGASLKINSGEHCCVLGGNGSGKTTMLNVISGISKAYRGKVFINQIPIKNYKGNSLYRNNLAYLPQDPISVFIKDTVQDDLSEILSALEVPKSEREDRIKKAARAVGVEKLLSRHPYDLSGGEQQKCAIAKMLLLNPKILLCDEPTKGIDAAAKQELGRIFKELLKSGITVLTVTHDVEFAAEFADRCALFFDGEILSAAQPAEFFAENSFYTTAANRMVRGLCKTAITCDNVVKFCKGENKE